MRRRVEQSGFASEIADHRRRVGKPDWIPVTFNLPRRGPSGTCAAVKFLERRRIEQKRFHQGEFSSEKVGQTSSLPSLPERPHRRNQGKLPVCPTLAPPFSLFQGVAVAT